MPYYCPVCSAFLKDPNSRICPRCGADIITEIRKKERYQAEIERKSRLVEGPFRAVVGLRCPECGEDVEILPVSVEEFEVKGEKTGKGPAGEEYALYGAKVRFQKWRCRGGHMLYSSYTVEWKELCPRCRGPMNPYGALVMSCPRCRTMVQNDHFRRDDPKKLMEARGYIHAPDLEG